MTPSPAPRSGRNRRTLGRIARSWMHVDRAGFVWGGPIRSALVCALLLAATAWAPSVAFELVFGAVLIGVVDPGASFGHRVRGMGGAMLLIATATALGVLVAAFPPARVPVAALFALVCGYLAILGPRGAAAGMVALVAFAVYTGSGISPSQLLPTLGLILGAGFIQLVVALVPDIAGRMDASRSELFLAWRALGTSLRDSWGSSAWIMAPVAITRARGNLAASGAQGATQAWLTTLIARCEDARTGVVALAALRDDEDPGRAAAAARFRAAAALLALRIGEGLHLPFLRRRVGPAAAAMEEAADAACAVLPAPWDHVIDRMRLDLRSAAALTTGPWPVGRAVERTLSVGLRGTGSLEKVRHGDPTGIYRAHAVRLAIAYAAATVVAMLVAPWFPNLVATPLTVALLLRPDLAGTEVKVVGRIVGTTLGLVAVLGVLALFPSTPVAIVLVGISAAAFFAFVASNQQLCAAGITGIFAVLPWIGGRPLEAIAISSAVGTGLAIIVTLAVIALWRPARSLPLARALADQAAALARYTSLALAAGDPAEEEAARRALVGRGVAAAGAIDAALLELGTHRLDPELAHAVFLQLVDGVAVVAAAEMTGEQVARGLADTAGVAATEELGLRLDRLEREGAPGPRAAGAAGGGRYGRAIERAHLLLGPLGG